MMEQARPALNPPESYVAQYQKFRQAETEVESKRDIMRIILPLIIGNAKNMCSSKDHSFQNLVDLCKSNIVEIQVDNYDGADPDKLDKELLAELPGKNTPVVPNFF